MILYVFHTIFPLSSSPVPLTILYYFCQCVQVQIPLDSQLGSSQPVPASINFLNSALVRQHYANQFPESLTWSYLQFSPPASAKDRQHFSLLAAAWISHLQLLTLNQRLATVSPSRSSAPLAIPPTSANVRSLDFKFREHHARSVSLNALHFMSTPPIEPSSPPRTVSSRTPPPTYAAIFLVPENTYALAQFTFQSFDHFLLALLCICVTSFLFLNSVFALYLYFQ